MLIPSGSDIRRSSSIFLSGSAIGFLNSRSWRIGFVGLGPAAGATLGRIGTQDRRRMDPYPDAAAAANALARARTGDTTSRLSAARK